MKNKDVTTVLNQVHHNTASTLGSSYFCQDYGSALMPSINFSSAYSFSSINNLEAYHNDKYNGQRYCRDSNSLVLQLERYFEAFYSNKHALLFSSGMSAISTVIDVLTNNITKVYLSKELYRKTHSYFEHLKQSKKFDLLGTDNFDEIELDIHNDVSLLVFIEMPSNPHLRIYDIERLIALKEKRDNIKLVIDVTFAGLLNHKNNLSTVDAIIHSCTKYISGHNDVLAGVALVNKTHFPAVWEHRSRRGGILDSMSSYLLLRSLRTYDIRIEKQIKNLSQIKQFLSKKY